MNDAKSAHRVGPTLMPMGQASRPKDKNTWDSNLGFVQSQDSEALSAALYTVWPVLLDIAMILMTRPEIFRFHVLLVNFIIY